MVKQKLVVKGPVAESGKTYLIANYILNLIN